jgi:ATP-dependent DNA helicase RecQ
VAELAEAVGMRPGRAAAAVGWLAREGGVRVGPGGDPVFPGEGVDPARAAEAAAAAAEARRRLDRSRVERVRAYAETRECRRRLLLGYFGQSFEPPCGRCDNCERGDVTHPADAPSPFPEGSRVGHRSLGEGTVMGVEGDKLVVLFDEQGYTTLSIPLVEKGNLLEPVSDG